MWGGWFGVGFYFVLFGMGVGWGVDCVDFVDCCLDVGYILWGDVVIDV